MRQSAQRRDSSSSYPVRWPLGSFQMNSVNIRLRQSLRRLLRRCAAEQGRSSGCGSNARRRSVFSRFSFVTWALATLVAVSFIALIFFRRRKDTASQQFMNSMRDMYQSSPTHGVEGAGEPFFSSGSSGHPRYDPKAKPFVELSVRSWGREAEKGKEKRRLFMRVHEMSKEKGRPSLTLAELMALPSTFDPSLTPMSDTTIILNHWQRTTLAEQLEAILKQTVKPAGGVWVCLFNSPREEEYTQTIDRYRERFKEYGGLYFAASSFNFKYYGRFQLALQAKTRYVWIIDDDVVPGSKFLHQLSHIAGIPGAQEAAETKEAGTNGTLDPMALGSVGWVMPGVKSYNDQFYGYRYWTDRGGLYLPDKRYGISVPHLQEVDLLCSHWFIETDWVKLLFREQWYTPDTGEDYMLAYSLRKYGGVRSYVLPMDLTDSETWGNTDVEWRMQRQGGLATTHGNMIEMRDRLWHRLFKRGGEYFLSSRYAESPRPVLLVLGSSRDAEIMSPLYLKLQESSKKSDSKGEKQDSGDGPEPRPPRIVLAGRPGKDHDCYATTRALGEKVSTRGAKDNFLCNLDMFTSAWQVNGDKIFARDDMGSEEAGVGGRHALVVDLASGLQGVVKTMRPLVIVSVGSEEAGLDEGKEAKVDTANQGGSMIDEAVSSVSRMNGVPWIRLPRQEDSSAAALWLNGLSPEAFQSWGRVRIDVLVVYDPSEGGGSTGQGHSEAQVSALLESLSAANYLGDEVKLTIAIGTGTVPECVRSLAWHHGPKVVRESFFPSASGSAGESSTAALGLRSWVPRGSDNFVVVMEADRVVSSLFYSWLKVALLELNYAGGDSSLPRDGGVCLPASDNDKPPASSDGAWLFAPEYWKYLSARCLAAAGAKNGCGNDIFTQYPENSRCKTLKGLPVGFVARTDSSGRRKTQSGIVTEDPRELLHWAQRALFEARLR